jgi:glutamyl-tRNA synthetase
MKTDEVLASLFGPVLVEKGIIPPPVDRLARIVGLVKERVSFVHELWDQSSFFFVAPETYDEKVVKKRWKGDIPAFIQELTEVFGGYDGEWEAMTLKEKVSGLINQKQLNFGGVMNCLRLALVGGSFGPDLFTIIEILGRDEVTERITKAVNTLGV